jgi:CrcB protein
MGMESPQTARKADDSCKYCLTGQHVFQEVPHAFFKITSPFFFKSCWHKRTRTMNPVPFGKLALLAAAGAAGTLSRYLLAGFIQQRASFSFPFGTLFVNVTGCFLVGLFYTILQEKSLLSGQVRIILLVGFFGAFSTFSSFILETGEMVQSGQYGMAIANVFLENILGFLFLVTGMMAGKFL